MNGKKLIAIVALMLASPLLRAEPQWIWAPETPEPGAKLTFANLIRETIEKIKAMPEPAPFELVSIADQLPDEATK